MSELNPFIFKFAGLVFACGINLTVGITYVKLFSRRRAWPYILSLKEEVLRPLLIKKIY